MPKQPLDEWQDIGLPDEWQDIGLPKKEPSSFDWWVEQGLRTVPSVVGSLIGGTVGNIPGGMIGGGLGSAAGNILGNWYSGREFNPSEFGVETALGAVPPILGPAKFAGKGLGAVAKYAGKSALSGALEGSVVGAGGVPFQHWAQTGDFDASPEEYLQGAGSGAIMGGITGGGFGAYHGHGLNKIANAPPVKATAPIDITPPPPSPPAAPVKPRITAAEFAARQRGETVPPVVPPSPVIPPATGGGPEGSSLSASGEVVTIHNPTPDVIQYWHNKGYQVVTGLVDADGNPMMVRGGAGASTLPPATEQPVARPDVAGPIGQGEVGVRPGQPVSIPNQQVTQPFIDNMAKHGRVIESRGPTHTIFKFVKDLIQGEQGAIDPEDDAIVRLIRWLNRVSPRQRPDWRDRPEPSMKHGDEAIPNVAFQPDEGMTSIRESAEGLGPVEEGGKENVIGDRLTRESINQETERLPESILNDIARTYPNDYAEGSRIYTETDSQRISQNFARASAAKKRAELDYYQAQFNHRDSNIPIPDAVQINYKRTRLLENLAQSKYERASHRILRGEEETLSPGDLIRRLIVEDKGTFTPQEMWENLKRLLGREPTIDELESARRREARPGESTGRVAPFIRVPEGELPPTPQGNEPLSREGRTVWDDDAYPGEPWHDVRNRVPSQTITSGEPPDMVQPPDVPSVNEAGGYLPPENLPTIPKGAFTLEQLRNKRGPRRITRMAEGMVTNRSKAEIDADIKAGFEELRRTRDYEGRKAIMDQIQRLQAERRVSPTATPGPRNIIPGINKPVPMTEGTGPLGVVGEPSGDITALRTRRVLGGQGEGQGEIPPEGTRPLEGDEIIADYLKKEDFTPPESQDIVIPPEYEEPEFARVEGGGYKASMNVQRGVQNITRDYTKPLPAVQLREGVQNALDAADAVSGGVLKRGSGEVRARVNFYDKTIEIHDNGMGMDDETLGNKLFEAFSTGKEGEEGATGGKGIGSASYIFGGKYFSIESIAVDKTDGVKYRINTSGTPEQFMAGQAEVFTRESVPNSTPTGTTIKISIKDEHFLSDAQDTLDHILKFTRDRPSKMLVDTSGDTTSLKDLHPDNFTETKFKSSKKDKLIGDFTTIHRNSKVEVLVPKGSDLTTARDSFNVHFLNNGMYQFSEKHYTGQKAEGVPENVLVNIHPLVDDLDELYPFINTREDVKKDIRDEVTKYIKDHISSPGISRRKNRIQELYDSMTHVSVPGLQRKSVIFDPGNRLTAKEKTQLQNDPTVQQMMQHYDKIIGNIIESTGRQNWIDRVEGIGIVLDSTMHGVHIPNPATGKSTILINPFERIAVQTPKDAAWKGTITGLHEVAHIGKEHGTPVEFTPQDLADPRMGEYFATYMEQLVNHGDVGWGNTGHGMDFAHRLGEVFARFGIEGTYNAADELHGILTGGSKSTSYSPEVQRLLRIYQESRGRDATTEDLLSPTGFKQRNRRSTTEGDIPSDTETNRNGAVNARGRKFIKDAVALTSNATTMLDLSAPGRQGLTQILTPEFWKALPKMVGALNYDTFKQIDDELRAKPLMQRRILPDGTEGKSFGEEIGTKIYTPASEAGPNAEMTASRWLENIPLAGYGIRATNRAYLTFLNHLNVNRTEKLLNLARDMSIKAQDTGKARMPGIMGDFGFKKNYTQAEAQDLNPYHNLGLAKEIAEFVNTATGHGTAKNALERGIRAIGPVLFSPGLLISRLRMMNPATYVMASPFVRKQYAKAALSTAAAWFVMAQLAKNAAGPDAEINDDITSADFGKVRVGDARLDLAGGFQQFAVAYGRLFAGGSTSSSSGEFHKFGEGYQAQTSEDMMERFLVNKLNPLSKFAWDIASASQYNPFHLGDRTAQMFVPLFIQDLIEIGRENPELLPLFGGASALGGGTQIYSKGESISKFLDPENDILIEGGGPLDWGNKVLEKFQ